MEIVTLSLMGQVCHALAGQLLFGAWQTAPMHLNLSADDVLKTTRSVRKRLDFDKPVERAIVEECLEIALQAPTGSNSQGWHWIIIEDAAKKKALADIYRKNFEIYASMPGKKYDAGDTRGDRQPLVRDSAGYLTDNFEKAPMMMIPCIDGRLDNLPAFAGATQTIGADAATQDEAALLKVPVGSPVLRCQRTTQSVDGKTVLVSRHVFPAHRTEFVVDLPFVDQSIAPSGIRLVD